VNLDSHWTDIGKACRFAMDRTPLQRMLVAAALHSLRPCPLYPPPQEGQEGTLGDSYRRFKRLGRLPSALYEDCKEPAATAADEHLLWHAQHSDAITPEELAKLEKFKANFKEVCLHMWNVSVFYAQSTHGIVMKQRQPRLSCCCACVSDAFFGPV
jgi:ribosomal protein L25 (general stress protein Ctc)